MVTSDSRGMAPADAADRVGGHGADVSVIKNIVAPLRQSGPVAVAAGTQRRR